jgi:deazaflavin-dependent oxidoreductase (nitroreductase family)
MADATKQLRIPPSGKRGGGMRMVGPLMKVFKPLMDMQISRYRKTSSPAPPVMMGFPVVVLTTVGAKTGMERTHLLGGFADGDDAWLIVASKGGAATHPAWFINLAKKPDQVWLEVGNRKFKAHAESLQGPAREAALARVASVAPRYGDYQRKTDREIPVIRLTPAS